MCNGATFAALLKNIIMRKYIMVAGVLACLWCTAPALAQDSSKLNELEQKVGKSAKREERAQKKVDRQRKKLERKEKKLERKQNKTNRKQRKRDREQRKLEREQEKRDSTTPSPVAYALYKHEEPELATT
jgi:septal ring factor EnvC (AmiA/AmiB activator)